MTMILSVLTPSFAVQVSDLRLTDASGVIKSDGTAKTTVFCGKLLFGFTGLAERGAPREPTGHLLAATLHDSLRAVDAQGNDWLTWMAKQLGDAVARTRLPRSPIDREIRRLAVIGVGFERTPDSPTLRAVTVLFSNFFSASRGWLPEANERVGFVAQTLRAPFELNVAGCQLDPEVHARLQRDIGRVLARNIGPEPIARLLVARIRALSDPRVGKSVLVSSLPLSKVPAGVTMSLRREQRPDFREATFLYVPQEFDEGIIYGPNAAGPLGVICSPYYFES